MDYQQEAAKREILKRHPNLDGLVTRLMQSSDAHLLFRRERIRRNKEAKADAATKE